jgi:DNA-binding winged helix-turn-helix (wHTH) protein/tetratricopeptide (TPR) repeat protein
MGSRSPGGQFARMRSVGQGERLVHWSAFEFDLETLRLRKHGIRLRMEPKPAQLLARLLEQPGKVVGRDELVNLLWPGERHGDFDQRLNKAIHKLRCVLGDDPANPRFVQTLSRYGYRFIADAEFVSRNGQPVPAMPSNGAAQKKSLPLPEQVDHSAHREESVMEEPRHSCIDAGSAAHGRPAETAARSDLAPISLPFTRRRLWKIAAGLVIAATLLGVWTIRRKTHLPSTHRWIAVLSFTNLSGNPADQWLSAALSDWLSSDLAAGDGLRAVSRDEIARFRSEKGLSDLDQVSPNMLGKMSHDLGSDFVLSGSYATSGIDGKSRIRLDVQMHDARSGQLLCAVSASGSRAEVFDLAASVGVQLRRKLRLDPLESSNLVSLRAMLPANPDAARFYAEGTEEIERFDPVDARVLLERAVALEPEHALSHAALSTANTMLGFSGDARTEAKRALDLAGSLTLEQRLLVEGQYHEANYQWDKAVEVYSRLFQLFPDSIGNGIRLARAQTLAGKPLVALDTIAELRQTPAGSDEVARIDIAEAEAASAMSDFRRQRESAARAADLARASQATELVARAEEEQGEALRALGNLAEARTLLADAQTRYTAIGDRSAVARLLIDQGHVRWEQGDPQGAESSYSDAVSMSEQIGDEANHGRALSALAQVWMYYVGLPEGEKLCNQALAIFRRTGNKQEEAHTLSVMADILFTHHAQAISLYQQSLDLSREVNDRSGVAGRLMDLGIEATVQGNLNLADNYLQQSLALFRQTGEKNREGLQLNLLAIVRTWQGRLDEAESLSTQAVAILTSVGEPVPLAQSRQTLGIVQMERGRLTDAETTLKLAIEEHRNADNPGGVAITSGQLAEVLLKEGRLAESRVALQTYDKWFESNSKKQPIFGEHVTQRAIVAALLDADGGKLDQARNEALKAVNQALATDQGSMLMKARLALGEIEFEGTDKVSGRRDLESLVTNAESKGFDLISHEAERAMADRSHADVQSLGSVKTSALN